MYSTVLRNWLEFTQLLDCDTVDGRCPWQAVISRVTTRHKTVFNRHTSAQRRRSIVAILGGPRLRPCRRRVTQDSLAYLTPTWQSRYSVSVAVFMTTVALDAGSQPGSICRPPVSFQRGTLCSLRSIVSIRGALLYSGPRTRSNL